MANPGLSFKKVAKIDNITSIAQGEIYFITDDKTIYVATATATSDIKKNLAPFYGGNVKNVTIKHKDNTSGEDLNYLTITLFEGNPIELDFSDIASMSNVDDLINALKTELTNTIGEVDTKASNAQQAAAAAQSTANANKTTLQNLTPGLTKEDDQTRGTAYYLTLKSNESTPVVNKKIDITTVVEDFIKDSFLDGTALIKATTTTQTVTINGTNYKVTGLTVGKTYIVFAWISADGKSAQALDVESLVNIYTAGNNGISVDGYKINLKLQNASPATDKNILEIADGGLKINTYDTTDTVTDGHFKRENSESAPNTWTLKIDTDAEANRIQNIINKLDSTVTSDGYLDSMKTTTQIAAKIVETDGKLTSVRLVAPATLATASRVSALASQVSALNITGDNTSFSKPGTLFSGYAGWTNDSESPTLLTISGDVSNGKITFNRENEAAASTVTLAGIATPTDNTDAANKLYVDSKVSSAISSALTWAAWS